MNKKQERICSICVNLQKNEDTPGGMCGAFNFKLSEIFIKTGVLINNKPCRKFATKEGTTPEEMKQAAMLKTAQNAGLRAHKTYLAKKQKEHRLAAG